MMWSIRNRPVLWMLLAATACATGCVGPGRDPTPVRPDPPPDEATLLRNAPPSVAYYENGSMIALPIYRMDPPAFGAPGPGRDYTTILTDIPTFLVQSATTPLRTLAAPVWTRVTYSGDDNWAPSFTVAPPLAVAEQESPPPPPGGGRGELWPLIAESAQENATPPYVQGRGELWPLIYESAQKNATPPYVQGKGELWHPTAKKSAQPPAGN
jgi:hypothetical protein